MRRRQNAASLLAAEYSLQSSAFSISESSGLLHNFLFSSEKKVFHFCLAFRMLNALLVQTYFNPDEHWQGPEVAHRIAFG